jgi:methylenetetrahydrofolate dehydrogenase (NADP+)/methenyltetrahydrofolate cyclohydrolase
VKSDTRQTGGHAAARVAAVGRSNLIQGEWIKLGAVVIDGGYNPGNIGDVDYDAAATRARLITPRPAASAR